MGCFPAGDNCFQKNFRFRFNKRDKISITFNIDDKNSLPFVSLRVGMLKYIEQIPSFDVKYDFFERDAAFGFQPIVFFNIPCEVFHTLSLYKCVLFGNSPRGAEYNHNLSRVMRDVEARLARARRETSQYM